MVRYDSGCAMQVARSSIVAQSSPKTEYLVQASFRENTHRRTPIHEAFKKRDYRSYSRLLKHDLRNPDRVCRAITLPRKVVAPMLGMPDEQILSKRIHLVSYKIWASSLDLRTS